MKRITFSRKQILRAIHAACVAFFFASMQTSPAAPAPGFSTDGGQTTLTNLVVTGNNTITGVGSFTGSATGTAGTDTVTIFSGETITTGTNLIDLSTGTVTNGGSLTSTSDSAVIFTGNGTVINSGTMNTNSGWSALFEGSNGTLNNSGFMLSNLGVAFNNLGTVTNSGYIGASHGTAISNTGGTVINSGTIFGSGGGVIDYSSGAVTNSGSITGTTSYGVGIQDTGTVTNTGSISSSDSIGVYLGTGTVINSGSISGSTRGVSIAGTGTVNNSGTINATNGESIYISGIGTVINSGNMTSTLGVYMGAAGSLLDNSGSITATSGDGANFGGSATVINSGSITGGEGVNFTSADSSLLTDGGTISGDTDSVELHSGDSTVTVQGRTDMVGTIQGNNETGNVLNLDLVGMTPAQAAALKALSGDASGSFTLNGYTYTWAGFPETNISATSLELAVDSGLVVAATVIDNHGLPSSGSSGAQFDLFYTAAASNPEAAMNELVGREINQGIDTLGVNLNTTLTSDINEHLDNLLTGGQIGGVDIGGLHIGDAGSMVAFSDTTSQLDSLLRMTGGSVFGGTELSTDSKEVVAVTPEQPRWGVWASGDVTFGDESGANTLSGFHSTLGSPTLGLDYRVTPNLVLGALFNYTTIGADFDDGSRIDSTTELGALYGTWRDGDWHVNGIAGGGNTQYNNQRATFGGSADSSPGGDDIVTDWTGGYDFHLGDRWNITPEVGLQYTHLDINSFTETGAGALDLSEGSQDIDSLRSHVGFNLNKAWSLGKDLTFIPELRAQWYHEFMDDSRGVSTSLPGAPALGSFAVNTFSPQRDFALVGVGLNTAFTGYHGVPVGLFLNYDAQVGQSDYIANSVNAGIRVDF